MATDNDSPQGETPSVVTDVARTIVKVTMTETMYVSVDAEQAEWLVPERDEVGKVIRRPDITEQAEAVTRFRRIAAHAAHVIADAGLDIEAEDPPHGWWESEVVDGTAREKYLWSARHFVMNARYELSCGRYREGKCPELDEVNRDLGRIEDRLRLMAMEVDRPDNPEVQAWRSPVPPPAAEPESDPWHTPRRGPMYWDWRCLTCGNAVADHPSRWARLVGRMRRARST